MADKELFVRFFSKPASSAISKTFRQCVCNLWPQPSSSTPLSHGAAQGAFRQGEWRHQRPAKHQVGEDGPLRPSLWPPRGTDNMARCSERLMAAAVKTAQAYQAKVT